MPTPILATKLYLPPVRSKFVARPRLIQQMDEGLDHKLTLISAPAGFGKSSLASEWVSACGRPAGWLLLDEGENDPTRFLAYLVAALKTVTARTGPTTFGAEVLGLLESAQPAPTEPIVTALLNEIAAIPERFTLVLDDYHAIDAEPANRALAFLLEHLPPQMHLVITTREDPNLPLARLRVRNQLTELRAADLRFTPSEAATFLNQVMGLSLTEADVSALEIRTEGWIAGLQLAALSMQGRADTASFIHSFTGSHRFVMDYLVEEVLLQQPEHIQTFLLHTSILDRLCGPLCDAVLNGRADSPAAQSGQEVLAYIEQANLFLVPLDNERRWYRYHHLFADLLRQRLYQRAALSPDEEPGVAHLHIRASRWHEENGSTADAVRHALAADDFERVARLAELAWPAMDGQFQSAAWMEWVQALPADLVRARPVLCVAYAWAFLNGGEMEAGAVWLRDAEHRMETSLPASESADRPVVVADEEQFQNLPASIATAWAYIAQARGDIPGSVTHARRALDLLPEDDYLRRGPALGLLGLAQWTIGDLEEAHRTIAHTMAAFETVGSVVFALSGTFGMADIRVTQGRLREAIDIYTRAKELADRLGEPAPPGTADIHLGLSGIYREQGNWEAARQQMAKSEELGEKAGLGDWPYRLRRAQAQAAVDEGDLEGALALLDEAARLYYPTPVPDVRPIAALKAQVWLAQGRLADAQAWASERGLSVDDELSFLHEFEYITLARILMAQNQNGPAVALLERLLQAAESGERRGSVIEILVSLALAHQAQNERPAALAALARALDLAEPEGYVRIFTGQGDPMGRLLEEAAAAGISPVYARRLRAAFGASGVSAPATQPSNQPLIEPLSDRELDVLKRLGSEMSGPEIAEILMISLNTLRTHTKNIYSKLGVNSRRAAVSRAQELSLL
ncbi:MAG: tetratricopeptide repeat protein [Caldilineaceae bacterium]